ncbi:MAG: phosphomannomutase/phosphoglucomutase [Methanobacteriota archaeon]|nr:MAG: phosphomannomutase/phosphoglucomutase [Euryarchaeota archaeon]
MSRVIENSMFREYDIRGRVSEEELNKDSIKLIARGFSTYLHNKGVESCVVGHDYRDISEDFRIAFVKGLMESGIDVIDIGLATTPMLYTAQHYYGSRGGAMITASHNPKGWSGLKLSSALSSTLGPADIKELLSIIEGGDFREGGGSYKRVQFYEHYRDELFSKVDIGKLGKKKVVVNCGNGTASFFMPELMREAGMEVITINGEPDYNFPKYYPNPSVVEMMEETGRAVVENEADIGIAFDGDGDRLGVVDEKGNIVWADRYIALLAKKVVEEMPGTTIVYDVTCSRVIKEVVEKAGGKAVMWKTGHSYIKKKLDELGGALAGEMSGHIFFGKPYFYGFDDATFAALKVMELIKEKPLSDLVGGLPHYVATPTMEAYCDDSLKYGVVEKIKDMFIKEGYDVIGVSGVRVEMENGWGLVRASSNLPAIKMRFEAKDKESLEKIKKLFMEKVALFDEVGKEWKSG